MPEQSESAFRAPDLRPFIGNIIRGFTFEDTRRLEAKDAALRQERQQRSCAHGRTCRMPPEQRCAGPECALVMVE
ncbi:hypothetical protein [Niveispirillum cyanobacteriorum]|uniref:Uncharacterized protein n=1 Tax=Niveispirillum cyanobacteriorum TaxID=1612173 RepID=A0A2K9NHD7_9PROT|nr:hypothetical protein [Niveispirillum cyanobacteriorum]AUN31976.1 hypothetical protein C0V82_16230 [Niveispirillum cyanobacteriorum]GGE85257.1 hypothetical protein GCM10011317_48090 [Niveispirillum cyanobacteriorum]